MKKSFLKKLTAVLLSAALLTGSSAVTVFAANGPSETHWGEYYLAYINLYNEGSHYGVFEQNEAHNVIDGASYDRTSNTLTLSNFKHSELSLSTNMMGDDFKLKVEGECELDAIYIWGDAHGGSLSIEGTGTLTVNSNKSKQFAITIHGEGSDSVLNFGKDVKVKLESQNGAAKIFSTSHSDLSTAISFGNGKTYLTEGGKEAYDENVYVGVLEVGEETEGIETNYGKKVVLRGDTDPNTFYAANYGENGYYVKKLIYLEQYDAIVQDYSFEYSFDEMSEEEFEAAGFSFVTENMPVKAYYTNDRNEQFRGDSTTKLSCSSDPDGVYVVNFAWIDDRDNPTDYFIHRLVWDSDLEFYVDDKSFESICMDPDEFAASDYKIVRDDDGEPVKMRYIDTDYFNFENYAMSAPKVVRDSEPDKVYIAQGLYYDEPSYEDDIENTFDNEIDEYEITELVYNEKRGYYFEGDELGSIKVEDFDKSGFHFIYEDQPVDCIFKTKGSVDTTGYLLYTDNDGNEYLFDSYHQAVCTYSQDNYITISDRKYYFPTKAEGVDIDSLTPVKEKIETGCYTYSIVDKDLNYNLGESGEDPLVGGTTGDCEWSYNKSTKTLTISGNGATGVYDEENPAPWKDFEVKKLVVEDGVTWIRAFNFEGLDIESAELADSVKNIGIKAFSDCEKLKSLEFPESLESIGGGAFQNCVSLESAKLPGKLTQIGPFAFGGCTRLGDVTFPDSLYDEGFGSFADTKWYDDQPDGLVYTGKVLYGYKGNIPENTTLEILDGTVSVAAGALTSAPNKDNIKDIKIPSSLWLIGGNAFYSCKNISGIYIPETVTTIADNALGYYFDEAATEDKKYAGFEIAGKKGSEAERYAVENGFAFKTDDDSFTIGDVNADGKVNGSDAGLLSRYTSGWDGYESKIKSMDAADINRDGKVNGQDAAILARHTSGWDGYERYFK